MMYSTHPVVPELFCCENTLQNCSVVKTHERSVSFSLVIFSSPVLKSHKVSY